MTGFSARAAIARGLEDRPARAERRTMTAADVVTVHLSALPEKQPLKGFAEPVTVHLAAPGGCHDCHP